MSESSGEFSEETVRQIAVQEAASCNSAKDILLKEHSEAYKWLMASLLAINAGALLKLAEFGKIGPTKGLIAAIAFIVGILCALAIAWLGQIASRKMLKPISELLFFWTLVSATGDFDQDEFARLQVKVEDATSAAYRARWAGWVSVVAFCVGLAVFMSGRPLETPTNKDAGARAAKEAIAK